MSSSKIESILVPLDYSPYSKIIFEQAMVLSKLLKVPVTAMHVAPDPMNQVREQLDEVLNVDKIRERFEAHYKLKTKNVKSLVNIGLPARFILDQAKQMKNPLVILGYKGRSAISRYLLGSVAEQVLKSATFPLWIHRGNKVVKPKRMLVPHDLQSTTDVALDAATVLNGGKSKDVEAYYVWEMPAPMMYYDGWIASYSEFLLSAEEGVKKFQKSHPKFKVVKSEGYPVAKILDREKKFDVIVLRPHRHSELFHPEGQITGKVVRSSRGPVVVVP